MSTGSFEIPVATEDGHRYNLIARVPDQPRMALLWLPALGVAARHYLPLAEALSASGVAVFLHEMRGNGSSNLRAGRATDWGYREILRADVAGSDVDGDRGRERIDSDDGRIDGGQSDGVGRCLGAARAAEPSDAPEREQSRQQTDVHDRGAREPKQPARGTTLAHLKRG